MSSGSFFPIQRSSSGPHRVCLGALNFQQASLWKPSCRISLATIGGAEMFVRFINPQDSLFDDFRRLHQAIDEMLSDDDSAYGIRSLPRGSFPAINVIQTPHDVQVYVFAAGVDAKALDVSIQQGLLRVSGRRAIARDQKVAYYRQERFDGDFSRSISLSDDIDPERVEANYRDGILQIKLHRREAAKPRQIEIH